MDISPYLTFPGTCEEAFNFYKIALKGEITMLTKYEAAPEGEGMVAADWANKIMHAALEVDGTAILGSDAPPDHYKPAAGFHVSLIFKNPDRAETVFNALAEGGSIQMALAKTFWARKFGMLTDQFGIPWMINCA